ncbi:lytic transglycosylase domain-containing protein [Caulobacter sp. RL271]|uniref:Lytic transglycosylase domain-containing protein n=1 Tax=Caulobacter segnis TaxID=88688 RepID=A0ABY4ZR28_9CAUL|nr:lytic transglycosylase domain-containing protein [Caulobacter segnis]USQ95258.1 lytic transglycosylase domain-containing protein [Caulobacter segnis]
MAALTAPPVVVETSPAVAPAPARVERWRVWIAEAAQRFDVPQAWIVSVMTAESGGRTHLDGAPITSRAGAMGLMQVMPATYRALAARHGLGPDPQDPRDNILAGAAYLAEMRARFGYPGAFAAYNAGPARYADFLRTGRALPAETQAYIRTLSGLSPTRETPPAMLAGARLFYPLSAVSGAAPTDASPPVSPLFAPLSGGPGRAVDDER